MFSPWLALHASPLNRGVTHAGGRGWPQRHIRGLTTDLFVNYTLVTADFFRTMRVPVVRGREFTTRDTIDALPVVVINEAMARRFWPGENPLGQRVTVTIVSGERPREIVGVVGDTPTSRSTARPLR
jgi:hypothetical protein